MPPKKTKETLSKADFIRNVVADFIADECVRVGKILDWSTVKKSLDKKGKKETEEARAKMGDWYSQHTYRDYIPGLNTMTDDEVKSACRGACFQQKINARFQDMEWIEKFTIATQQRNTHMDLDKEENAQSLGTYLTTWSADDEIMNESYVGSETRSISSHSDSRRRQNNAANKTPTRSNASNNLGHILKSPTPWLCNTPLRQSIQKTRFDRPGTIHLSNDMDMSALSLSAASSRIAETLTEQREGLREFVEIKAIIDDKIPDVVRNFVDPMSNELASVCSVVKENRDTNSLRRHFAKCQSITQSKVADEIKKIIIEERKKHTVSVDLTDMKSELLHGERVAVANELEGLCASLDLEKTKFTERWANELSRFDEEYETELLILKKKYGNMKDKSTRRKERELKVLEVQFLGDKKILTAALNDIDNTLVRLENENKSKREFRYQCIVMAERYLQLVNESAAFFAHFYESPNDKDITQRYEQFLAQKQAFWTDIARIESGMFIYDDNDP
ncbi:hypothetical protein ACHAW6_006015 [Cyclotella cf. meneghiniana]